MYAIKKDSYSNTSSSKYISSAPKKTYYDDTKSDTSFSEKSIDERRIEKHSTLQPQVTLNDFKQEFDKTETILEYVKGIDSESKAIFEEVNKRYVDYDKIHTIVSNLVTTTIPLPTTTLPTIINNTPFLPITTNSDELETLIQLNKKLITTVNKLVLEVKHVKMELLETTQKLDYISSHVEHLYDKSFVRIKKKEIVTTEETSEEPEEKSIILNESTKEIHIEDVPAVIIVEDVNDTPKIELKNEEVGVEDIIKEDVVVEDEKIEEKVVEEKVVKEKVVEEDEVEEPKQFFKTSAARSTKRTKK